MSVRAGGWSGWRLGSLSDEEVLLLAQSGNRLAVEHILARYRGMVEGKARSYFLFGGDHDDVVQEGMIGLYKAIRDFQGERLVRFRAFAEVCITRQIISAVKSANRRKHLPLNRYISLHRPSDEDDGLLLDMLADNRGDEPETALMQRRLADYLERFGCNELSELEKQVIQGRLEGRSYRQVADELHCSFKRVDNALQRARKKILNRIENWQD